MKKIISTIVCIAMLLSITSFACIAGDTAEEIQPRYNSITDMTASLSISAAGVASCGGSAVVISDTLTIRMSVALQKYTATGWKNVKLWSTSGSTIVTLDQSWNVAESGRYRTCVTVSVYNANELQVDYAVGYSSEKVYTSPYTNP